MIKDRAQKNARARRRKMLDEGRRLASLRQEAAFDIPEISDAHAAYVALTFERAMKGNVSEESVKKAYLTYQNALIKYRFSEDEFDPKPACPICGDSGFVNGKMCECMRSEYIKCLAEECRIDERAPFRFEDADFSKMSDPAQRQALEKLYPFMRRYAHKLPDVKIKNIVFYGGVGTGKSCLASATVAETVKCGNAALMMSAYEFNSLMLTCHTSPIAARKDLLEDVLTCELLVIDDLGTEPTLKNVTVEYLLLVLEERLRHNLCTLITTNLGFDRISAKYGERIFSRLTDKAHSLAIEIQGDDLRYK